MAHVYVSVTAKASPMTAMLGATIRAMRATAVGIAYRACRPVGSGQVVAGDGHKHVGGAFPFEETDVCGDDEDDGYGAEHDSLFHGGKDRRRQPRVVDAGRQPAALRPRRGSAS